MNDRMTAEEYREYLATGKMPTLQTKSKYRNRKTELDGVTYDSKKEARRAAELNLMFKKRRDCNACAASQISTYERH